MLAKFDADADYLDEDVDFTFDDFEIPEKFNLYKGWFSLKDQWCDMNPI